MSGAWTQLEQLLTCAICLDRYRNPKLLPCHHTYCQEPCLEGLVDYARRQIKCPECRAEHRIPYQGVSTFPTNVTLVRFLELHRSITGEEPEPIPSMMERCGICSEKSTVERCAHCDKKICLECKEAHLDILKRELSRINAQVRRALTRLTDSISATEKNCDKLLQNKLHIREEIEEIIRRFVKDLKDKESKLLHELEEYASNESNSLTKLKEDLNIEAVNITSNCDLIEKHVLEQNEPWTDAELVEYKDIFLKTLDFLRNFDPDTSDYTRRIRFIPSNDLDTLKKSLLSFGELKLPQPNSDIEFTGVLSPLNQTASTLNVPSLGGSNALMRSQSDHRLAAQFARNERSNRYLEVSGSQLRLTDSGNVDRNDRAMSPLSFRRSNRSGQDGSSNDKYGSSRYGEGKDDATRYRRTSDYTRDWPRPDDEPTSSARDGERFKSRFLRSELDDDELSHTGSSGHRSVRFEEPDRPKETPKVFDTLDAPRGPLSGVPKITDTTHLMNRLHELQVKMKLEAEKKADEAKYTSSTTTTTTTSSSMPRRSTQLATRQPSEDEIDRQKKANQAAAASASSTTTATAVTTTTAATTGDKDSSVASVTSTNSSSGTTGNTTASTGTRSTGSSYLSRRVSNIRDEDESNSTSTATSTSNTRGRSGDIGTPPTGRSTTATGRSGDANSSSLGSTTAAVTGTGDDDEDIDSSSSSALARLARRRKSSIANSTTTVESPSTAATSTSRLVRGSSNSSSSGPGSKSSVSLSSESDHGSSKPSTNTATKPSASLNNTSSSSASASAKNAASLTATTSRLTGPKRQSQVEEEDEDEEEEEVDDEEEYEEEEEDEEEEEEEEEEEDEEEVEDEEEQEMRAESTDHTTGMSSKQFNSKINQVKSTPLTSKTATASRVNCGGDDEGGGGRSNVQRHIRPVIQSSSFAAPGGSAHRGNGCDGNTEEVDDDEVDYDEDEDEDEEDETFVEHLIFHPNTRGRGSCNSNNSSSKIDQQSSISAGENMDDGEDDVNILLERAARVRREFASGSSNSSLNSNDTISSNLRTLRPVASKEVNDILTPLHGSNGNLNLRSNYARLKASQAASLDSSGNCRVDRQNASNNNIYHPLRRFGTSASCISGGGGGGVNDQPSKCGLNNMIIDPSSPSHLSHLTSSSVASSSMAVDGASRDLSLTPTRNARSVNSSSSNFPVKSDNFNHSNYNYNYNRRLSSPVSPVCSFLSEEGGGSSSTDCYFDATPSFKSPSPPPPTTTATAAAPTAPARKRSLTSTTTATTSSSPAGSATSTVPMPSASSISPSSHFSGHVTRSKSTHAIRGLAEDNKNRSSHPGLGVAGEVEPYGRSSRSYSTAIENPVAAGIRSSSYQYRTRDPKNTHDTSNATDHQIGHGSSSSTSNPTSTWAQYLKSKYGSKERNGSSSIGSASDRLVKSRSSGAIYSRSSPVSSDDESGPSSFSPRRSGYSSTTGSSLHHSNTQSDTGSSGHGHGHGVASIADSLAFGFPRNMYLQKKKLFFKFGSRGTDKSQFTWPRAVTVGLNNDIVVADSSNHRVQVFDSTGKFKFQFGQYGTGEGEFDCLAGVAVNKVGQLIVSDRYNHRVQIFDAGGRFLRSFGTEGRADGKFSYPWGITTDSLGFIYVCDKENHRIQVFQSDGTFVGKFGSFGSRPGQLEHPHYIAVSNTNRVIVSDSNNHRIQIFDVNGRSLTTFGVEGSDDGQFKFPRGVAVDDQGYIIVGDSGNNRIQVFNPDGTFLRSFGSWGSADGEFKGLEGVAISSHGHILVCDRENHRVQVF